ncbi:HlyD family secretion protein [Leadbetterella sp. DM7]|uniref:HlyD family secretion protein n=1 Tax=Leadbetterella sp. DM7 TaxID=3235085 RepID=UPI00349EE65F
METDRKNNRRPELVNSTVDEVLNRPPGWLLQWGTTLFFAVICLVLAVSWFIQYPDLVSAPLRVLPAQLPKSVVIRSEGRLEKLWTKDGQKVKAGDILAYLESTADHEDVLKLEKAINELMQKDEDMEAIYQTSIPLYFNLGDLQKSYQVFREAYTRSKSVLRSGTFSRKKGTIAGEISSLKNLRSNTYEQLDLQEKDLKMALEEAQSQQRLADKGFVPAQEAKNAMSRYLNKKQAYEQARASLENNTISQNQKQQELLEMDKTIEEHNTALIQAIYSLKSDIQAWKQRYLAIAPIAGTVHFTTLLQENQQLKTGEEIMVVVPGAEGYFGEMWVGQYNFGKIRPGQEVIVKFEGYPFQEFGTVTGRIREISEIPKDTSTLIQVDFPNGLLTNSGKKLPFKYGMKATGDIVTEDLRLIERFFYDLRKILKR